VVIVGVLELCNLRGFDFRAVLIFRVAKSFRILRALRTMSSLQLILAVVRKSIRLILGCFVLMTVFFFFFAVISCQVRASLRLDWRVQSSIDEWVFTNPRMML
jgi:hypothetical protein